MKILYLPVLLLVSCFVQAQDLFHVSPGTTFSIRSGTAFSAGGLTIIPSVNFDLGGASFKKASTTYQQPLNNYIARVYQFTTTTAPFSGSIYFQYDDAELKGLSETSLRVNIHDGNNWRDIVSQTNDAANNFVHSQAFTNRSLKEITLADAAAALPLTWGTVTANREVKQMKVAWNTNQEHGVSHFVVERSENSYGWKVVKDQIPATNSASPSSYSIIDDSYSSAKIYYRVKQVDTDGRSRYSAVATVPAMKDATSITVFPNPFQSAFYINHAASQQIKEVQLTNLSGALVKKWMTAQTHYQLDNLTPGIYHLRVQLQNGSQHIFTITKQ